MGDRGIGARVLAAIGERVRGDVDDAHHPRPVQPQDAAGAIERGDGVEHQHALQRRTSIIHDGDAGRMGSQGNCKSSRLPPLLPKEKSGAGSGLRALQARSIRSAPRQLGRASWWDRVCLYVWISVVALTLPQNYLLLPIILSLNL